MMRNEQATSAFWLGSLFAVIMGGIMVGSVLYLTLGLLH
jgi:hypothetical protein